MNQCHLLLKIQLEILKLIYHIVPLIKKINDEDKDVFCVQAAKKPDIETLEVIEEIEITTTRWLENKSKLSAWFKNRVF